MPTIFLNGLEFRGEIDTGQKHGLKMVEKNVCFMSYIC